MSDRVLLSSADNVQGLGLRVVGVGHAVFAGAMILLGVLGVLWGNFVPIWIEIPPDQPALASLARASALLSLVCGVGLLWSRAASVAARVLFIYLLAWMLAFNVRDILLAPLVEGSYQACGTTAVVVAGSWVLYAWFASDWDRHYVGFLVGDRGVRLARVLYGLALLAFGLSHFFYLELTTPLVPSWLGAPLFWAYFTGVAYLAAGAALLCGCFARLAAVLSAWQIGLFLLLVWMPIVAAGHISAGQLGETLLNVALVAGAWVVADSYRSMPWLALNRR